MEPTQNNSNGNGKKVGITIAVVAILALLGITIASNKKAADQAVPTDTTTTATAGTPATTPTAVAPATTPATTPSKTTGQSSATLKDGTYTATGSYMSPGGLDHLGVTVTLKSDIVTDVSVTPKPGDGTSARYQAIFAANYKQYVVGKDITTLKLDKVSGSSLTGKGFNDAVAQIEAQAKV